MSQPKRERGTARSRRRTAWAALLAPPSRAQGPSSVGRPVAVGGECVSTGSAKVKQGRVAERTSRSRARSSSGVGPVSVAQAGCRADATGQQRLVAQREHTRETRNAPHCRPRRPSRGTAPPPRPTRSRRSAGRATWRAPPLLPPPVHLDRADPPARRPTTRRRRRRAAPRREARARRRATKAASTAPRRPCRATPSRPSAPLLALHRTLQLPTARHASRRRARALSRSLRQRLLLLLAQSSRPGRRGGWRRATPSVRCCA